MENFQQPQMSASQVFSQSTGVSCEGCGSIFFEASVIFRKVSKIVTGTSNDQLVPVMAYRCQDCLQPLAETIPAEVLNELMKDSQSDDDSNQSEGEGMIIGLNK